MIIPLLQMRETEIKEPLCLPQGPRAESGSAWILPQHAPHYWEHKDPLGYVSVPLSLPPFILSSDSHEWYPYYVPGPFYQMLGIQQIAREMILKRLPKGTHTYLLGWC